MKTKYYNPSKLEIDFAKIISELKYQIEEKLPDNKIVKIENKIDTDNPSLNFFLLDDGGDPHEVVIKIIQIPDKF